MSYRRTIDTATIPNAGTTSDAKTVPTGKTLVGMEMPSAMTGTAITFQASVDGGTTWVDVYNGSSAYSITLAVSKYHALDPAVFYGLGLIRLVSGSTEAAERLIRLAYID